VQENFAEKIEDIVNLLRHNPNIILYGPPGTGKTYTAMAVALYMLETDKPFEEENLKSRLLELANHINVDDDWTKELNKYKEEGRFSIVQFHPSYNYDDFVIGIEARTEDRQVGFEKVDRTLKKMSEEADREPDKNFVLIIDEINRANLPAVFGELIYALEYRGEEVDIMYGEKLIIPPNLYIIGTMNTADRSAGRIDYAIRRRFTFYPMHADESGAEGKYGQPLMKAVNKFIENNISPEYDPEDIKIGHTYFMSKKETDEEKKEEIAYKFLYQVVPLLYEYIKDGLVRAEREEGKGYKVKLSIEHGTGEKKEKTYYLRGGRLYDGENIVTLEKVKEFLGKQGGNNSGQNANSEQEKPEEPPQSETSS